MKNPTNTNAADAKEIQTQLAGEKGGGRAYWNAVKKSKDYIRYTTVGALCAAIVPLCFYVLGAFLPSVPGCARDADPRIKTPPGCCDFGKPLRHT